MVHSGDCPAAGSPAFDRVRGFCYARRVTEEAFWNARNYAVLAADEAAQAIVGYWDALPEAGTDATLAEEWARRVA